MTRRLILLELASRPVRTFVAEARRHNRAAAAPARAQREGHLSPLALAYRSRARLGDRQLPRVRDEAAQRLDRPERNDLE